MFAPKPSRGWIVCRRHNGGHELRHQLLTARQVTDIVVLDVPQLVNADLAVATTLAHAFRLAGTRLLNLDSRELGSFVMSTDAGPNCGVVLFDSMPGGAGHVAELLESPAAWIEQVTDALIVTEAHHRHCVTACLDCLLSFESQYDHDQGLLHRARTWAFWDQLRSGKIHAAGLSGERPSTAQETTATAQEPTDRSIDAASRLARARRRRPRPG
jgi:hypothetical protein